MAHMGEERPTRRWKDNIKMDLQEVGGGGGNWMELAQDRDRVMHSKISLTAKKRRTNNTKS